MQIDSNGFIIVDIDETMRQAAQEKSDEMGVLRNSIRQGKGNLCGFLGEEIILKAWPGARSHNTYNHDIDFEGARLEIKSKDRTVPPRLDYEASIAKYNDRQSADFYVFVSILRDKRSGDYTRGYICGMISPSDYKNNAVQLNVGDIDPSNGWKVSAACHNLPYSQLHRFGE